VRHSHFIGERRELCRLSSDRIAELVSFYRGSAIYPYANLNFADLTEIEFGYSGSSVSPVSLSMALLEALSGLISLPSSAAVVIEPVSADTLSKTGISGDKAETFGDFPSNLARRRSRDARKPGFRPHSHVSWGA
jgi:hypothetical protein